MWPVWAWRASADQWEGLTACDRGPGLLPAFAGSHATRRSRVLLSRTRDAAGPY